MSYLFNYHISYQSNCKNLTELPFQIFGLSQQGSSHFHQSIGNQDAGGVFIGKNILIGVIADGCSEGKNIDGFSSNQVGAQIACNLNIKIIRRLLTRKKMSIDDFKINYTDALMRQYRRLFNAFSPWKKEKKLILSNLFSSTFIAFVITPSEYMVFNYGDGNAFINSQVHNLKPQSNQYFSNRLINHNGSGHSVNFIKTGVTDELKNILISTDGFTTSHMKNNKEFQNFFFKSKPLVHQVGFVDKKTEFRMHVVEKIINKENSEKWPYDDATFISLKRIPQFKN